MSKHRHRVPIYTSGGHYILRWVPKSTINQRLEDGEITLHRTTNQYRLTPRSDKPQKPVVWSPTSLTEADSYALAGVLGHKAQKQAQHKLSIWRGIHDTKAVCV